MRFSHPFLKIISIVLAIAFVSACNNPVRQAQAPDPATPTPIPTPIVPAKPVYTVQKGEVVHLAKFTGRVSPIKEVELFFRVGGRLHSVLVQTNDRVKAGQVLAELEMDSLARSLEAARLELERAQVRLKEAERDLQNAIARAQLNLDIQRIQLEAQRARDPKPRRAQAELALQRAKIALDRAQGNYDAVAWRSDIAATPQAAALQMATIDYQQAQAAYDLTLQDIAAYDYQIAILEKQVALDELAFKELQTGVDPLIRSDLERAQLAVKRLEAEVADHSVVAPFDGQVMSVNLSAGRTAEAFKPGIILGDISTLEVTADLTDSQLRNLKEGMEATMLLTSFPDKVWEGVIRLLPYPYGGGGRAGLADQDRATHIQVKDATTDLRLGDL
ncbi:MAG: efflux RND transporter periplasmic adaptor subunit, partial [Anaerolineae bacterium]|nr:efflux RND transporter periplasmic adaptor subunit [Anaerolineae bacterium]